MAEELERPPLKDIYRKLIADNETNEVFKKYSYNSFRDRMLNNPDASSEVADFLIDRGIIRDKEDWQQNWLAPSVVKQAPTPTKSAPVQAPPLLQPAQPSGQPSLTAVTGQQAVTPMAAPQGPNFQQFDSQKEIDQAALSPVFKENQLALSAQKDGLIMPTKEAEQDFNQLPADQQRAAIEGGTGNQLGKDEAARKRTWGQTFSNLGSQLGALGQNIKSKVDSGLQNISGYIPTSVNFMIPGTKEYDEGFLYRQNRKRAMFDKAQEADKALQDEATKNNIETSVIDAIGRGEYGRVPEAVGYNIGQAGLQILPTIFTGGYSMFLQTLPDAYKSGVERMAEERGITPQEVIDGGYDSPIITNLSAGVQMMLEKAGAGFVQKSLASKGGISAFKDWLKKTAMGETAVGAAIGEGVTEAMQTDVSRTFDELAASSNSDDFMEKLNIMYADPEFWDEIVKSAEGGVLGGGGLSVTGGAIKSALSRIGGKKGPSTPPTSLGGIPVENVPESAPEFEPEVPTNEQAVQDDQAILEGQQRSGFQFVPPTQSLPQEAKSLMQSVVQGKMVSVQPVKDLLEGLYNEYKIFRNQAESTNRTLTQSQIDEGVKDYEGAMDLLGEYISKRDGGTFMQEFAARAGKDGGVMVPGGEFEGPQIEQTDETIPIGQRAAEVIQTETTPAAEEVVPVAKEESVDDGERNSPKEYSKKISLIGSEFNFDKPQRKNYPEGVEGDKQYGIDNIKHNEAVDNVIGNLTQEGTLTDNEGNKYGVTITSQGVRVVGLLADGSESENIVYRKGQRRTAATPFTNGFRFKANETTTTTTPTTSLLGETTEATGQTGGGLGTDVPETQEQGTDQIPVANQINPVQEKVITADQVRDRLQEIEKNPVKINISQDANGKMAQTSEEVIDNIKVELDKTRLPYSDVIANEKGSTYFVVTKDGKQHEILRVLQSGGALVPTNLTKAKWINHLIKTDKDAVVNAVSTPEVVPNETPLNPAPIPVAADETGGTTADVGTEPVADESGGSEVEVEPVLAEEVAVAPAEEEVVVKDGEDAALPQNNKNPDIKPFVPNEDSYIVSDEIKNNIKEGVIPASMVYSDAESIRTVIDGVRDIASVQLTSKEASDLKSKGIVVESAERLLDKLTPSTNGKRAYIIGRNSQQAKDKIKRLKNILGTQKNEIAQKIEIGELLGYQKQDIIDFIERNYNKKGVIKSSQEIGRIAKWEKDNKISLGKYSRDIVKGNAAPLPQVESAEPVLAEEVSVAPAEEIITTQPTPEPVPTPLPSSPADVSTPTDLQTQKPIVAGNRIAANMEASPVTEGRAADKDIRESVKPKGMFIDVVDIQDDGSAVRSYRKPEGAKAIKQYPSLELFSHKNQDGTIGISEDKYGYNIISGKTLKEATEKLDALIERFGGEEGLQNEIEKRVEAHKKPIQSESQAEVNDNNQLELDFAEPTPTTSPFTAFDPPSESMSREQGRKARAALKEKVGKSEFARMENIHKNSEKILRGLEKNGTLKIECP